MTPKLDGETRLVPKIKANQMLLDDYILLKDTAISIPEKEAGDILSRFQGLAPQFKDKTVIGDIQRLFLLLAISGEHNPWAPWRTLKKAINRINFEEIERRNAIKNGRINELAEIIDTRRIEPLEPLRTYDEHIKDASDALRGLNMVSFDGSSIPIVSNNFSTIYARGGSFGYSQRKHNRLNSKANKIWTDVAINIATTPKVIDHLEEETFDKIIDDVYHDYPFNRVNDAEIEALTIVETASVLLCLEAFADQIDVVIHDGPIFSAHSGYKQSLIRMKFLYNMGKPSLNWCKNPVASPVMKACEIRNMTDTAFFGFLGPMQRSPMFLRHDEGKLPRHKQRLKRVFFYFKTPRHDLCRIEVPYWYYEEHADQIPQIIAADCLMNNGRLSYMIANVDAFVRIRTHTRRMLRSLQKLRFEEQTDIPYSEPYNQVRWRGA